jgi:flagellar hook protein FlgE
MMRSLFTGVSGLRNSQVAMDVIGNNVANANTLGFKSSRVTFAEGYSQLLQGAQRAQNGMGGTNAQQVGLGVRVGSIDTLFSQGAFENTGLKTDLAISGSAFFAVSDGTGNYFTRAGNFQLDSGGRLVSPGTGYVLQGRMAVGGELVGGLTDIVLPFGQKAPAVASTKAVLGGNLDASAPTFGDGLGGAGDITDAAHRDLPANRDAWTETTITAYDSLGAKHDLKVFMWKTGANAWSWQVDPSGLQLDPGAPAPTGSGTLTFDANGRLTSGSPAGTITFTPASGAGMVSIDLDPGAGVTGLTQFASRNSAVLREQDGYPMGTLADFAIDASGTITGTFDNGTSVVLAQIAMADFNNPSGLNKVSGNVFSASPNSGEAVMGYSGEGSTSTISSSMLEMSNVDLSGELTRMIIMQRAFAANGRVISSADQMLQEVVALGR